ncbi:MAG: 3,4-dihydroxy-2-butanone-4-phosphate synthase [Gammaproteobacteria bacterium]|nr:3,4-dihydroxy-2-butanone-4-phosphate synthase [Gammaproteobacteria bacterium]
MPTEFDTVEDAIAAIAAGDLVVVVDDDDRENEGDLIMAAAKASSDKIGFMIRHTSGLLCASITEDQAKRLHLDPMVARNEAPLATAYTVTVDYKVGLTTGISADERANTVQALASNNTAADDFARPGHVLPLVSRQGGVLVRSGHTEAAVDLAHAAGLPAVGVLAEIVNDDGNPKKLSELREFASEFGLKIISIADLIAYRQHREQLVIRTREFDVETAAGRARGYAYRTRFEDAEHLALVFGDMQPGDDVVVRIHREKLIEDVFGSQTRHEESLLEASLNRLGELGGGVLISVRCGFAGAPLENWAGGDDSRAGVRNRDWLEIGVGAQILRNLGVTRLRILAGREVDFVGLEGFGLTVVATDLL